MRIGIYGGSFDPVHSGHIALARHAHSELNTDRFFLMPSAQNPLKLGSLVPAQQRLTALKKAAHGVPGIEVSDFEIYKQGVSYTVDTLRYFKKIFGKSTVLYFIAGADCLKSLPRWKSIEEIFRLCRFVVGTRPGYDLETDYPVIKMPFEAIRISSTEMRRRLKMEN